MLRRLVLVLVVVLAAAMSVVAAGTHAQIAQTNEFFYLFVIELFVAPVGGSLALGYLVASPPYAPGMVGAGLYALAVGVAFLSVFPVWLPTDDTILGTALLAMAGAAVLAGCSGGAAAGTGLAAGFVAFLLFTASGMVWPLFVIRLPVILALAVLGGVLLTARRRLPALAAPGLLAALGAALTVGLLLARGPGDWASASGSLRLFGFPEVVMGVAIALGILDLSPEAVAPTPAT